jgi:hypothetical protein
MSHIRFASLRTNVGAFIDESGGASANRSWKLSLTKQFDKYIGNTIAKFVTTAILKAGNSKCS